MVAVSLTEDQMLLVAQVAMKRVLDATDRGLRPDRGYANSTEATRDPLGFLNNLYGAAAELVVAQVLDVMDQFPADCGKPDLVLDGFPVDVKHCPRMDGRLIVPMKLPAGELSYFLVVGVPPDLHLVGAITDVKAREHGRVEKHRKDGEAIYVAQQHLIMRPEWAAVA